MVIATSLGLFCLVVAVGALGLWAAVSFLDLSGSTASLLVYVFAVVGGVVLIVYLVRASRRR